jgi:hypothetical protein
MEENLSSELNETLTSNGKENEIEAFKLARKLYKTCLDFGNIRLNAIFLNS